MDFQEVVFESCLALFGLTALNRLVFHEMLLYSILYGVCITASFWVGRLCVKLGRGLLSMRREER